MRYGTVTGVQTCALPISGLSLWCLARSNWRRSGVSYILLAVCVYWSKDAVWAGFIAPPVMTLEASLLTSIASPLYGEPWQSVGNVLFHEKGREMVILKGCSVLDHVGPAVLGAVGLSALMGGCVSTGWRVAALCALVVIAANVTRILAMMYSDMWHAAVHGPQGSAVFSVGLTAVTLLVSGLAARR